MTWASADDVLSYLGVTLPDQKFLTQANTDISVYVNRSEAASASISNRDLLSLKLATCYQAAWLPGQADKLTRTSVQSSTVDGETVRFKSQSQQDLAPLALRALKNLSWKGSKTLVLRDSRMPLGRASSLDFLSESSDESSAWEDH